MVGADGTETGAETLAAAAQLAAVLGAALHIVSAHDAAPSDAEAVLWSATRRARAEGLESVTHMRREEPAKALIAVAEEQEADLLVMDSTGMSRASRFLMGSVPDKVSHHPPCSILIVRTHE